MSATMQQQETMTVSRSTIIELIAALDAAGSLVEMRGKRLPRELCADAIRGIADDFRVALLGPSPDDDDAYSIDPTLVELLARSDEFEAEMIARVMSGKVAFAKLRADLEARDGRAAQLREHAKRVRAAVNIDVPFVTSTELLEQVRLERDAAIEESGDDAS